MAALSLNQIKILLSFFTTHMRDKNIGIKNYIDKIDYYNSNSGILSEI